MKRAIIYFIMAVMSVVVASQTFTPKLQYTKLEAKAIRKMRHRFKIGTETKLSATVLFELYDPTMMYNDSTNSRQACTIGQYLEHRKVFRYETVVYDEQLHLVFIDNRIFLGSGKYKKEYYIGNEKDRQLAAYLQKNQYDYICRLSDIYQAGDSLAFLCFKGDKMYLAHFKDRMIETRAVTKSDSLFNSSVMEYPGASCLAKQPVVACPMV